MNSNLPLVSILMTAYNREKYIAEAIESVLGSTFKDFELIIVDDCSTDNTLTIASSFVAKDKRIKVFKNDFNLGQFDNRNRAIELAKGKYIKFLDSDDKIMSNGLEVMVQSMQQFPLAGIGVPSKEKYDNNLPIQIMPHESVSLHYQGENHLCFGPTGTIFTREALLKVGLFEGQFGILADTLLNIKIASLYPTIFFEKKLFYWRRHDEQVTEEQEDDVRMIRERNVIMKAALEYQFLPLNKNESNQILKNFIKINTKHFLKYIFKGRFKDAIQIKKDTGLSVKKVISALIKLKS